MSNEVEMKIAEAKAKLAAAKPAPPATPAPKSQPIQQNTDVVKYLEGKVEQLTQENMQLRNILQLYGEHAAAVWDLTSIVFGSPEHVDGENADTDVTPKGGA